MDAAFGILSTKENVRGGEREEGERGNSRGRGEEIGQREVTSDIVGGKE